MFSIVLDSDAALAANSPSAVLLLVPGQQIRGVVRYLPDQAEKVIGVYIKFVAYEHTEWKSKKSTYDPIKAQQLEKEPLEKGNKRKYHANEIKTLWGHEYGLSEKHAKPTVLEKKVAEWPFIFTIPANGPPSLSYKDGKIRVAYKLTAFVRASGLLGGKDRLRVQRLLFVGIPWDSSRPEAVPFKTKGNFGSISADVDPLRNCTWPGDDYVFNLTLRSEKYSQNHTFTIRLVQRWEAGSYVPFPPRFEERLFGLSLNLPLDLEEGFA